MTYRVLMSCGEGLPTRLFGGDYETEREAERAKRNVEKTTHYRATIEEIEMPTATKKTKKKAKAPSARQAGKPQPTAAVGMYQDIAVERIQPSPANPRKHFDEGELKKLAKSLKEQGQQQNLVVYQREGKSGPYEIIAGERRWRAAKIAKLKSLVCNVLDVTDEEAIRIRGLENVDREDFNAFELARWYGQLRDDCGMSQRAIAKFLGASQGQVGNTLALLRLPKEWEQHVISQEITATCLRHLARWSHRPNVLEGVSMALKEFPDAAKPIPVYEFRDLIDQVVAEQSRSLAEWGAGCRKFKLTEKRRGALDIEEVDFCDPIYAAHNKERAFNIEQWEAYQAEAVKREKEKIKKEREQAKGNGEPASERPSSIHEKIQTRQEITPNPVDLQKLWGQWYRHSLADRLEGKLNKSQLQTALHLGFVLAIDQLDFCERLDLWFPEIPIDRRDAVYLACLGDADFAKQLPQACSRFLRDDVCWQGYFGNDGFGVPICRAFAASFNIDAERDWRPEYEWLDLLTLEQIHCDLPIVSSRFVRPAYVSEDLEKREVIEYLVDLWDERVAAELGIPEILQWPEDAND